MIYYKNKENHVYSYAKSDIEQVFRLTEIEVLIAEQEPIYSNASSNLQRAEEELNSVKELLELEMSKAAINAEHEDDWQSQHDENIKKLTLSVDEKAIVYDEAVEAFSYAELAYLSLKKESDNILPIFLEIRENLKILKKMTSKEVDTHLSPPIPKEQLIAEAEQKKQLSLADANNAISPLQYAVDLGMATGEEKTQLTTWKKYIVLLNRVDTSTAPDIEWPLKP